MKQNEEATPTIIEVGDDYSLIVADSGNLQQFFSDGENLQKVADRIENLARGLVADVSTKEGISQIKTAARQIASVKKKVDDLGKTVVAELKALPKIIDKNRADFRERMERLQEEIRRPVTDIEERQKAIDDIKGTHFACAACNSQELAAKIEELETQRAAVTAEVWKEAYEEVLKAFDAEIGALSTMKSAAEKREEDARRLAELEAKQAEADRIIREQKIKEEAERKAREEAEARAAAEKARLEREKQEAERRAAEAEMARQEAEDRARREAMHREQDRAQAQAHPAQEPAPAAPAAPAQKPSKWTPEMKAVNKAIVKAIAAIIAERLQGFTIGGYELAAREIVKAIVNNKINHLSVRY
jgi:chromosome segregation ATPase